LKETRKAELKGAGLVHGENWAARCEPAEVSDGLSRLSRLSLASCGKLWQAVASCGKLWHVWQASVSSFRVADTQFGKQFSSRFISQFLFCLIHLNV